MDLAMLAILVGVTALLALAAMALQPLIRMGNSIGITKVYAGLWRRASGR